MPDDILPSAEPLVAQISPVIRDLAILPGSTHCAATWKTDRPTSALAAIGSTIESSDPEFRLTHYHVLDHLSPGTEYILRVEAKDRAGNKSTMHKGFRTFT